MASPDAAEDVPPPALKRACQPRLILADDSSDSDAESEDFEKVPQRNLRVKPPVRRVERPEEGKALPVQRPVYYLSEVLSASKQNYPHYQKMCYGIYFAAKKVKQYFQEHTVIVVSTAPSARS